MKKIIVGVVFSGILLLSGCGQIDYSSAPVTSSNDNATQIEIQSENVTEKSIISETTCIVTESNIENNTESVTSDNSGTLQSKTENKQTVAESNEPITTTANDVQTVIDNEKQPISAPETTIKQEIPTTETTVEQTTPVEEKTSAPITDKNLQSSDIFKMLDNLNYHAISCDGLPEYELTSPDGVVYYLNLSSAYVWRRPSLIADADNEAPLTQEVIDAIYKNWDYLNIVEALF